MQVISIFAVNNFSKMPTPKLSWNRLLHVLKIVVTASIPSWTELHSSETTDSPAKN